MLCLCGANVLRVAEPCDDGPRLLDEAIHACGIWTVDDKGIGGRLTVQEVWDGVRGHHEHFCPARNESQPALFEVAD